MKTIEQEKKAVKKLKNYLILLMRVLAILFIVFAFAQPYTGILVTQIQEIIDSFLCILTTPIP